MSPAQPSTAKGVATRARLLEVAAVGFAEKGYSATKFSELITASGLTKGAFYFYFPSKAALAAAVIADQERRWVEQVECRVLAHPTPTEQLADLLPAMLDLLEREPGAWSVVRLANELGADDVLEDVTQPTEAWVELLTGIIRAGQQTREFRAELDAEGLATVLVGAFHGIKGLVDVGTPADRGPQLARHADILADLAFAGLGILHHPTP
ncbi:TetR family transcriptional regulator [Gordonia sp. HNM0687]|uniref:TetR family transcriptional regulator n=1 Tax=Gordonia mangrovi TaxID=2665643 RepID=A0A6L7GUJ4_9ACTN|nr:TetR/AcrR family transcriptional regulator [Gordonia mangrovi]MXP23616.1 TetR family transcriptional regulator [Gordonia mangrovi]UVF79682.1 TetR/AcrR family transcriptional regulator [Gordonia mangrovi]